MLQSEERAVDDAGAGRFARRAGDRPLDERKIELRDGAGRTWRVAGPRAGVFEVDPHTAADLAVAAGRLVKSHCDEDTIDDHDLLIGAEVALRQASPDLLSALVRFRLSGTRDGIMLVRGLAIDDPLPATPPDGTFKGPWHQLGIATVTQLMLMSALGDVISYADEKEGHLVQDICPVPGAERRQENTGSCLLELHTEDGFHPNMPHFLSLLTLRPDQENRALTVAAGIRAVLPMLDPDHVQVLREPQFRIRLASSFVGTDKTVYSPAMPVLTGAVTDPDLCVDFHATEAMTPQAAAALDALRTLMLGALVGLVLQPGDLLIVDNRKAVHGRTGFTPSYDGEDRWLRRCFAVADIRASHPLLYPSSRVHRPLSEAVIG